MKAIDLFAGAGGFSEGARQAGIQVVWAANHWEHAVSIHATNHPNTKHICQDLHQADWTQVPKHDIVLASPACQGFSRARGKDKSYHDALRSTAWAVVSCLETHRSPFALVENVKEFLQWELYPSWQHALKLLGYTVTPNIFNAADFGVPQARERLFILVSRKDIDLTHPRMKHQSAKSIIDLRKGVWSSTGDKAESTTVKIQNARKRYGDKFLIAYYGSEKGGRDLYKPLGTLTTKDRFAIINGGKMRMLTVEEQKKAMGFPEDYILPPTRTAAVKMLGNAVCPPVACELIKQIAKAG